MKFFKALFTFLYATALLGAAEKPNILFILTDDQSPFDFKFHNPHSTLDSPNIDRLASGGMIFDAAHHMGSFTGAVCVASRHMIMSGRTVWHLPVGPGAKDSPPKLEDYTIGAVNGVSSRYIAFPLGLDAYDCGAEQPAERIDDADTGVVRAVVHVRLLPTQKSQRCDSATHW